MKRVAPFLLLCLAATVAWGTLQVLSINRFSGINSDNSSLVLTNGQTPDSQNVVTDNGPSLEVRKGFVAFSTEPSRGLWSFPLTNGTKYLITVSSNNLKATQGTSFTIGISTVALSVPTYGTSLGDKFFFINTVDGLKAWDGSSIVFTSSSMKADKIATFKGRLAIGNVTGNTRVIYLSKYLDGTTLVAPTNPSDDDATQLTVSGALDEALEGLYGTFKDKLIGFKANSFFGVYGSRRSNFTLRTFSDFVGLAGSESVQDCDGLLRWLGRGRKVFEFDGSSFHKISEDIDVLAATIAQGDSASRSNTQTSAAHWGAGTFVNAVYVDTETVSGDLRLTFPDTFDYFRDGTSGTKNVWTKYASGTISGSIGVSSNQLNIQDDGGTLGRENIYTTKVMTDFQQGTTYHIRVVSFPTDSGSLSDFYVTFTSTVAVLNPDNLGFNLDFKSTTTARMHLSQIRTKDSGTYSAGTTSDWAVPCNIDLWLSTSSYNLSVEGVSVKSGAHTFSTGQKYIYLGFLKGSAGSGTLILDDFGVTPETATFTSQVMTVGTAITSWGVANITDSKSNGTLAYQFNASSSPTIAEMNPSSWTTITNGAIPTNGINSYAAFRTTGWTTTVATGTATLSDFSTNWNEGSAIKLASIYPNQRYWLSVSVSSTANNYILVCDKQGQWQKYFGMNADAMTMHNSKPYFGNSTGIYEAENGYNDNGSAIAAYYRTPTLLLGNLNTWGNPSRIYMTTETSDATLSTTYQMNGIATDYSLGSSAMNTTTGIQDLKLPFSMAEAQQGKYINFKWSVSGTSFWRIINANLYYEAGQEPD